MTAFDSTSLEVIESEDWERGPRSSGPSKFADSKFIEHLQSSYDRRTETDGGGWKGAPLAVTVEAQHVNTVRAHLDYAAAKHGLGRSLRLETPKGIELDIVSVGGKKDESGKTVERGTPTVVVKASGEPVRPNQAVKVRFAAKPRNQRKPKTPAAE